MYWDGELGVLSKHPQAPKRKLSIPDFDVPMSETLCATLCNMMTSPKSPNPKPSTHQTKDPKPLSPRPNANSHETNQSRRASQLDLISAGGSSTRHTVDDIHPALPIIRDIP